MQISALSSLYVPPSKPAASHASTGNETVQDTSAPATAPIELPPLRLLQGAELPRATAEFAAEAGRQFRAAGIAIPPEPVLGMDRMGKVVVANEHPDKARIEQLFVDTPALRDRFAELSAAHQLQRAVTGYDEFVGAYERLQGNPAAQAALVRERIAHNNAQFFMRMDGDGGEPFFAGLGRISA